MVNQAAQSFRRSIERLLSPQSIAVVGTSQKGGRGANVHRNLLRYGYRGRLFGVNPNYQEVLGTPCFANVGDLPEVVDCAIIALPAEPAIRVAEQCTTLGIGGAIIFASGFKEMGPEGVARQERLSAIARAGGLAICGPNCFGLVNVASSTVAFSGSVGSTLKPGNVALVSQSGGLSLEVATTLAAREVGLTHIISSGNEAATTLEDYLDVLVDKPDVQVIAAIVEGFKKPRLFADVAQRAADRQKPMVILKMGSSPLGRVAVSSHTGSLAGDDRVVTAVFEHYGVTRAYTVDQLVDAVTLFSARLWPTADGTAFVSGSGGRSAMMADLAAASGVALADYSAETRQELARILPEFGAANNPLDLTGAMYDREGIYPAALATLARDPNVGLLAVYQGVQRPGAGLSEERAARGLALANVLVETARESSMPVVAFTTIASGDTDPQIVAALKSGNVPLLIGPESGLRAIRSLFVYRDFSARRTRPDSAISAPNARPDVGAHVARLNDDGMLSEYWSKQLLLAYGIPTVREVVVGTEEEAMRAAREIGYPVVLKAVSPHIIHKSDLGLVRLDIRDGRELAEAFRELWNLAERHLGDRASALEGILVEEQVPQGLEVIVGARATEFGPVVLFGAGGVLAELVQDTSLRLAPITRAEAVEMIGQTRVGSLLTGARGRDPLAVDGVIDVITRLSQAVVELSDVIGEVDINPLIVLGDRVVAVDAVVGAISTKRADEAVGGLGGGSGREGVSA